MSKSGKIIIVSGLVLGFWLPFAWAETADPVKGKAIYERLCITCHGTQGKGDGPAGSMMTPRPADFTSSKVKGKPDSELVKMVQDGRSGTSMAGFKGNLSEQQVHDVVSYVRTFGK